MVQVVATAQLTGMFVCFQLVCLTDLENDFINPFDLSSKMNRFVVSKSVMCLSTHVQTERQTEQLHGGTHAKGLCRLETICVSNQTNNAEQQTATCARLYKSTLSSAKLPACQPLSPPPPSPPCRHT